MKFGLKVLDPGKSPLGDGKYVTHKFGYTSDDINEIDVLATLEDAETRRRELNATNIMRFRSKTWKMEVVPTYTIIAVTIQEVSDWTYTGSLGQLH